MRWLTIALICICITGCIRVVNSSAQPISNQRPQLTITKPSQNSASTVHQPSSSRVMTSAELSVPAVDNSTLVGVVKPIASGNFSSRLLMQPGAGMSSLRLYIEANKYGWLKANSVISKGLGYQLYLQDPTAGYIEFPCMGKGFSNCEPTYRQGQRFATEQAGAFAVMLSRLKHESAAKTLEVVAVGDAAAFMLKVAALTDVIDHLHSVDGTLSPAIWARRINQPPPLSSDPLIYHKKLQYLAQTHWIASSIEGAEVMAQAYKDAFADSSCIRIRLVNGAHSLQNWRDMWPLLVNSRFRCEAQ